MLKQLLKLNPFSKNDPDNKLLYIIKIILTTQVLYLLTVVLAEALIIGISYFFGYNATTKQLPHNTVLIISFFGYIIPIIAYILYNKIIYKSDSNRIGLGSNILTYFKGLGLGLITITISLLPLILCGAIKSNGINHNIKWIFIIIFFIAYLIQSTLEELICRGIILHRLKEKLPLILAIIISIVFFATGHISKMFDAGFIIGMIGVINVTLISLIFTLLTIIDKNIYSAIGFHHIWNFVLYSIIGLNLSGIETKYTIFKMTPVNKFLTGSSYGIESGIITTISYLIICIILFIIYKKKNTND